MVLVVVAGGSAGAATPPREAGVCAELANRGVKDVLIVCCDGLTGFPEAIEAGRVRSSV
jgi:hypothetical protein